MYGWWLANQRPKWCFGRVWLDKRRQLLGSRTNTSSFSISLLTILSRYRFDTNDPTELPYSRIDSVFNGTSFYANIQSHTHLQDTKFNLDNGAQWKSMSSQAIVLLPKYQQWLMTPWNWFFMTIPCHLWSDTLSHLCLFALSILKLRVKGLKKSFAL